VNASIAEIPVLVIPAKAGSHLPPVRDVVPLLSGIAPEMDPRLRGDDEVWFVFRR
jgi:hypothetical protein